MAYSYLYVRRHPSYDLENACKLGKADNIPDRESTYLTGEVKRGKFVLVLELPKDKAAIIEKMLQNYFAALGYHVRYDGGTEFFHIDIIHLIVPYMKNLAINFRVLSDDEINQLTRAARVRKETQKKLLELLKIMRLKRTEKKALTRWLVIAIWLLLVFSIDVFPFFILKRDMSWPNIYFTMALIIVYLIFMWTLSIFIPFSATNF